MKARDFRAAAKTALSGKWGTFAIITLLYVVLSSVSAYVPLGAIIVGGPLVMGLYIVALMVARGQDIEVGNMFDGFKTFGKSVGLYLVNNIFIFLWTLLFFVPGLIKTFAYQMSYYIIQDHPEMTITEARKESIRMMKGNKWRLFCLNLSFTGWILLSFLTCGILMLWVAPYTQTAVAAFYEDLKAKQAPAEQTEAPAIEEPTPEN